MRLTRLQFTSILVGTTGVLLNTTGLLTGVERFNFFGVFFGRTSAAVYLCALDKFRWWSFIPLGFTIVNLYYNSQQILFMEFLSQSVIYQIVALITFRKLNKAMKTFKE